MNIKTKGIFTFPGGVHPPEKKELTGQKQIEPGPVCNQVAIPLSQHIGALCQPIVEKNQSVAVGQKIGDAKAFVCAPVHSPIAGKVKEITLQPHAVLGRCAAVVIDALPENVGAKQPAGGEFAADFDESRFAPEQIRDAVRDAGIVGMGGAGFPTSVKLDPSPQSPKEVLIVNGCECEPYITCDYRIMLEWPHQIIAGAKLAKKASGCSRVLIAIEDNKPQAIEAVGSALRKAPNPDGISVVPVKTKYPQGGERQLIRAVLNKVVPTGGIPPMIGVVVVNVATAAAIAEAVVCNRPLTHRVVTVTGEGVARCGNFYVPIGIPVGRLIDFCGGPSPDAARVIIGGPMMGIAVADLSMPVTKTTNAVTVLTEKQIGKNKLAVRQTPCIRCGRCLSACPEHLNPTKIAHAVKNNLLDVAQDYYMTACIECGCCSYVCPANIELTGHIKTGKILLARQQKRMPV